MTPDALALAAELKRIGVKLMADGERIRYRPKSKLTPDLLVRMRNHKAGLLAIIGMSAPTEGAGDESHVTAVTGTKPAATCGNEGFCHADEEWRRFCSVAIPSADGLAWVDPTAFSDPEGRAALEWSSGLRGQRGDAGTRPPDDLREELRPFTEPDDRGSLGYRTHLARVRRFAADRQGR